MTIFNVQRAIINKVEQIYSSHRHGSCVQHAILCCFTFLQGFKKISETIFKI